MATILNAYDLSLGDTETNEIADPNNVRIQYTTASVTDSAQAVTIQPFISEDATNWAPMPDENDRYPVQLIKGNNSLTRAFAGINATALKFVVTVPDGSDGTLTIISKEA